MGVGVPTERSARQPVLVKGRGVTRGKLVSDGIEAVGRSDSGCNPLQLDPLGRIAVPRQHLPSGITLRPCLGKAGIGLDAKGERLLLAQIAIVHAPVSTARRRHEQIEPVRIGKLIGFSSAFCRSDRKHG